MFRACDSKLGDEKPPRGSRLSPSYRGQVEASALVQTAQLLRDRCHAVNVAIICCSSTADFVTQSGMLWSSRGSLLGSIKVRHPRKLESLASATFRPAIAVLRHSNLTNCLEQL